MSSVSRKRKSALLYGDLWAWGDWLIAATCKGLGYPGYSVEGRMMKNGGFAPATPGSIVPYYFPNKRILILHNKITQLPNLEQEVLAWRYGAGCSYDEIKYQLDLSYNQVQWTLQKAHKNLKSRP